MNPENAFVEIAIILVFAAAAGMIGYLLKQPLIISFIAVGILVGPSGPDWINRQESIPLLAEIGINLLLFVVGLKLDLSTIRTMGVVALITGLVQVILTAGLALLLALGLNLPLTSAAYTALAVTFSSTIIIVKLLSDKGEIDALHGQMAVGILIVQDLLIILVMIGLTTMAVGPAGGGSLVWQILGVVAKGLAFLAGTVVLAIWVLPRIFEWAAKSVELMLLIAIGWALIWAAIAEHMDFSMEVGAFLAGVSLASTPFRDSISSRLVSLRDFLLLFFFIDLGSQLDLSVMGLQVGKAVLISLFVLIVKPVIVMAIMGVEGYRKRTGFLTGVSLAQISEFSLILGALGLSLGHISADTMGLITLIGMITIGTSSYMIIFSGRIYEVAAPALGWFERKKTFRETSIDSRIGEREVDAILFGMGTYGGAIARHLIQRGKKLIGVDHDPRVLKEWRETGVPVLYGDAQDPELFDHLPIERAHWVVNATPGLESGLSLLVSLRERRFPGKVVLAARRREEAEKFQAAGADLILRPFTDASEQAVDALTAAMDHLSREIKWPVGLREIRLKPGSVFAGKTIRAMNLRAETGAGIMAVSRAGRTFFDPEPDFTMFPGDRMVLLGKDDHLARALAFLEQQEFRESQAGEDQFTTQSWVVPAESLWVGQSLRDLNFRRDFGATVIGVQRGEHQIVAPNALEIIQAGDILLLAGNKSALDQVAAHCPICRIHEGGNQKQTIRNTLSSLKQTAKGCANERRRAGADIKNERPVIGCNQ